MRHVSRTALNLGLGLGLGLSLAAAAPAFADDLTFDPAKFTVKTQTVGTLSVTYRAYEGLLTVKRPVDAKYETLNIYIPVEYFQGKGKGAYTAATAPIFLPNSVGGYLPGAAGSPGKGFDGQANAALVALSRGLVVAEPGARGRTLKDAAGTWTGKAPAALVDLKAAVRYLRANDALMPGNAERIVSDGTSAGGALSALLGATGNSPAYEADLKALGAADTRDDIWAVASYCPITNLENADSAYEWWLGSLTTVGAPAGAGAGPAGPPPGDMAGGPGGPGGPGGDNPFGAPPASASGPLTPAQQQLSAQLRALFPAYVNSLGLKAPDGTPLTLAADGSGTLAAYVKSLLIASAQTALAGGQDLSKLSWVKNSNGRVTDLDLAGYLASAGRKKGVPAFDALDASSGENNLFGTAKIANQHFTGFGKAHDSAGAPTADPAVVKQMNPMAWIGAPGVATSRYWRIRHGTLDTDTSLVIPALLAAQLTKNGAVVDFALPWNVPHSGDYDLDQLFNWVAAIGR